MRVLITSAGERVELVEAFRRAVGPDGEVHAGGTDPTAPALLHADRAVITPAIRSPDYEPFLLDHCRRHGIGVVIPLIDLDVVAVARAGTRLAAQGTVALAPMPGLAAAAHDKAAMAELLTASGVATPRTVLGPTAAERAVAAGHLRPPMVVKPRWGRSARGVVRVTARDDLRGAVAAAWHSAADLPDQASASGPEDGVIIQEYMTGPEIGLDVVGDLGGRFVTVLARRKLRSRAGETFAAETIGGSEFVPLGQRLAALFQCPGPMDVDLIATPDGDSSVLDVNPRFGGGYAFSHAAGADVPAAVVAWLRGGSPAEADLRQRIGVTAHKTIRVTVAAAGPDRLATT